MHLGIISTSQSWPTFFYLGWDVSKKLEDHSLVGSAKLEDHSFDFSDSKINGVYIILGF